MTGKVWVCDDEGSERFPVFTRGNVGEVFVEAVSPLTWSAYGPHAWDAGWRDAFCGIGLFTPDEFKPAGRPEIVGCFGGYVYINMSVTRVLAVRIPGMTVEAIDKSLFGDYPDVPPYHPDPRDVNAERTAAVGAWLMSLFTDDPRPDTAADRVRLDALLAGRPDFAALSEAQLLGYFRSLRPEARRLFDRHVRNTYGGNVLTSVVAQVSAAVGADELAATVTSAVGDVESAAQSFDLWTLSRTVNASPVLTAAFDAGVEGLLDRLRTTDDRDAARFLDAWGAFIGRWGFLGPSVWEFRSATYATDPGMPLRMLDRTRRAPDDASPGTKAARLAVEREAAVAEIQRRLSGNPAVLGQFTGAARNAGRYLAARESGKLHCAMLIDAARGAIRELGRRLVQRGQLARWEDVLLVTDDEADDFVADPVRFGERIADRAVMLEVLRSREPPFVFVGDPPPLEAYRDRGGARVEPAPAGTRLQGIGVSPGRHTGRARIITTLDVDTELQPGEVIVAVTTDSFWGPLFLAAGAVVVETGAAISHAAIVSRELGVPAAVSVSGATQRIPEGAMVTVEGNTGVVTLE